MNRLHLPLRNRKHFHEYRCIVCNSVLETRRSMSPRIEYVLTDRCYNCSYEISYSLATTDETSSQEFLQTRLPLLQAAEQIANEIAEDSDQLGYRRPWGPTKIDVVLEPDDETTTEPSLYDETPEERAERFRNPGAVRYPQTHDLGYFAAALSYSPEPDHPESDDIDLELSQLGAYALEVYGFAHGYEWSEGEASELDPPEGDAHPVDNASAPHQSPDQQEEGLNIMRHL
ncbi:uncharacterized protein FFB20_01088 [Fusarium fujikuroi]|uniref:Uncharacterized protein n=2 Tax=Fusarium fujikuroi TaxID=5127 RepID=S0EH32_GIBF5|nr:uncharacterized protein FFUJ_09813 [Fusarium fujikuroi IMI 58289]KLO99600.1 uncharacterized protein LW94_456 [Fusarium fujikuroi]KLP12235.1 uncharacterized protein Y057_11945 [Fusarium fujikuroi]CCT74069.1 uncharacterized protein FFUJ_09813 [Fusarium fujikuroi IMI 58289]SCN64871.1 uncharacterized protein FFB20_01088 [Fusarium fujikuroi]SCO00398.1 uncharacterized protein FFC1_08557 [Fusarium fujikuroi]